MILVVSGSRHFQNRVKVFRKLNTIARLARQNYPDNRFTVLVGDCPTGADKLVFEWLRAHEDNVRYLVFSAHWGFFGRKAGPMRNREMVAFASSLSEHLSVPAYCIGFLKNGAKNAGTLNCLKEADYFDIQTFKYWGE